MAPSSMRRSSTPGIWSSELGGLLGLVREVMNARAPQSSMMYAISSVVSRELIAV